MSRLINADKWLEGRRAESVLTSTDWGHGYECGRYDMIESIAVAPTVDAVPVVHGRWGTCWLSEDKKEIMVECSECGAVFKLKTFDYGLCYNYCPNCGAKMDMEVIDK